MGKYQVANADGQRMKIFGIGLYIRPSVYHWFIGQFLSEYNVYLHINNEIYWPKAKGTPIGELITLAWSAMYIVHIY